MDFFIDLDTTPKFRRPELLFHPPIPAPLHGVNPRSVMGQKEWDIVRRKAYAVNNDCCFACGVHRTEATEKKWLEAHEIYDIDYKKGKMTLREIVALCHYCHGYVHRARLQALVLNRKIQRRKLERVLAHGETLIRKYNPKPWYNEKKLKKAFEKSRVGWNDWRLVYEGKEYGPKFPTPDLWAAFYDKMGK